MFWKKKSASKLDRQQIETLSLGYLTAADEIEALVDTIRQRLSDAGTEDRPELESWHEVLVRIHTRILSIGKQLPPADSDLAALASEAEAMEAEIAPIAESLWGYDEARVSGLLLAWGVLKSNG